MGSDREQESVDSQPAQSVLIVLQKLIAHGYSQSRPYRRVDKQHTLVVSSDENWSDDVISTLPTKMAGGRQVADDRVARAASAGCGDDGGRNSFRRRGQRVLKEIQVSIMAHRSA